MLAVNSLYANGVNKLYATGVNRLYATGVNRLYATGVNQGHTQDARKKYFANANKPNISSLDTFERQNHNQKSSFLSNIIALSFKGTRAEISKGVHELLESDKKQKKPFFLRVSEDYLTDLIDKISNNKNQNFVISIAGESASGKTTVVQNAGNVMEEKGLPCTIMNSDDYFKDVHEERAKAGSFMNLLRSGHSYDVPNAVDLPLLKSHLEALKRGEKIKSPTYDFLTSASTLDSNPKDPAQIIISEGLFVLEDIFNDVSDTKIYVDAPPDVIKDRWFERTAERGTVGEDADFQFNDVTTKAEEHVRPKKEKADIVLSGLADIEYQKEVMRKLIELAK